MFKFSLPTGKITVGHYHTRSTVWHGCFLLHTGN